MGAASAGAGDGRRATSRVAAAQVASRIAAARPEGGDPRPSPGHAPRARARSKPPPPQLWRLTTADDGSPAVAHVASLAHHTRAVNAVRWSPDGARLASAGDGGEVYLWAARTPDPASFRPAATLRAHSDDVFDVAWAPDGSALATASLDNAAAVFDVAGDAPVVRRAASLEGHKHYVQGVAWDPAGAMVATQSADRSARVWARKRGGGKRPAPGASAPARPPCAAVAPSLTCLATLARRPGNVGRPATADAADAADPLAPPAPPPPPRAPLFADETLPSFFRRLAWSPDGSCLATPAALLAPAAGGGSGRGAAHGAFLYARGAWDAPLLELPSVRPVVAVRFCPVLFRLDPPPVAAPAAAPATPGDGGAPAPSPSSLFDLPYRLVFAVASLDSVAVYATDDAAGAPLALLGGLHPEPITDLAWACDGRALAVSSYDGYVSVATFDAGELGVPVAAGDLPAGVAARVAAAAKALPPAAAAPKLSASQAGSPAAKRRSPGPQRAAGVPPPPPPPPPNTGGPRRIAPLPVPPSPAWSTTPSAGGGGPRRIAPTPLGAAATPVAAAATPAACPPPPPAATGDRAPRRIAPVPIAPALPLPGAENETPAEVVAAPAAKAAPPPPPPPPAPPALGGMSLAAMAAAAGAAAAENE